VFLLCFALVLCVPLLVRLHPALSVSLLLRFRRFVVSLCLSTRVFYVSRFDCSSFDCFARILSSLLYVVVVLISSPSDDASFFARSRCYLFDMPLFSWFLVLCMTCLSSPLGFCVAVCLSVSCGPESSVFPLLYLVVDVYCFFCLARCATRRFHCCFSAPSLLCSPLCASC